MLTDPPAADPERRLFDEALDFPAGPARDAWLAGACGGDEALRSRILALLRAHEQESQFLPTAISTPSEQSGERIGRYKLLQQIGEGGFGSVWMAEQMEPVTRRVALKIIKLGMDTREVIARFEAERQALAMMDHPNIAKVLDAGATDKGRPFFVMELVKGVAITQYCNEAGLSMRERLALFGDVCSAINHAHQKGIIHRDIKPSNVMVTMHGDKAVVKVIDFGIAKATQGKLTDKTLFTRFEQFIGTPVYMSPEQAATSGLDIDTRSDIYALGILLYEMLVGKPPFDAKSLASAGYEEMRRIIREVEPPKPSSRLSTVAGEERTLLAKSHRVDEAKLNKLVEPDLDWIVMKAIDKDRTRRYETANGLAQDIVRFLSDQPVTATPPSAGYQFRKFARRNKAALRVGAAIAAVLVAATVVSTWQAFRATDAEKKTAETLAQVTTERDAKEEALKDAEATSKFMTDMFTRSKPGAEKGGREVKVVDLLDPAVAALEANPDIPPARRAKLQKSLGATYGALGLYPQAIPLFEKMRDHHTATHGREHPETLYAMGDLAGCYRAAGRYGEALKMREEVLLLLRKVNGPEHPKTLEAMADLAYSRNSAGRRDEAIKMQEEVLPLLRKVNGPEHPQTLEAMADLAFSYFHGGRRDEALKLHEEVLALYRKALGPEHPGTLRAMNNLGYSYSAAGRVPEALKLQEEVVPLRRKVLGPEHPETLNSMRYLADYYSNAGLKDEALKLREEMLALSRKALGPEHSDTLSAMDRLARELKAIGRRDEALKLREELLTLRRKVLGPEHPNTLMSMNNLAISYSDAGRKDEALKLREQVLALRRKVSGPEHPQTILAMNNLAPYYFDAGRRDEALKMQEEVLALSRKVLGPEHRDTLAAMNNLAGSYSDAGRKEEALKLLEEVLTLRRKVNGPEHSDTLSAMDWLARDLKAIGRRDESLKLFEETLTLCLKVFGKEHGTTLGAMDRVGEGYHDVGRKEDALKIREERVALSPKLRDPGALYGMRCLADSYDAAGRKDEAEKLRREVKALEAKK